MTRPHVTTENTRNLLTGNQFRFSSFPNQNAAASGVGGVPNLAEYAISVNVPSIEFISAELATSFGVNVPTATGKFIYEDLTVGFLVDENMTSWRDIYEWLIRLGPLNKTGQDGDTNLPVLYEDCYESTSTGYLDIMNSAYQPKWKFKFNNMFPISLTGFSFTTSAADTIAMQSAVTFRYSYYTLEPIEAETEGSDI